MSDRKRPDDPVVGSLPTKAQQEAQHARSEYLRRMVSTMVVTVVVLAAASVLFGVAADSMTDPRVPDMVVKQDEETLPRRDIPANVDPRTVVHWVPVRTTTGRTELEPWSTVDEEWLESEDTLNMVMARSSDVKNGTYSKNWPIKSLKADG